MTADILDALTFSALWTVLVLLGMAVVLNVGERRSRREQGTRADAQEALARKSLYPDSYWWRDR